MEGLLLGSIWHYFFSVFFWWANLTFFEFLIFVCASYLLGNLILKFLRIDFQHPGEQAVYSVILGYGGFGLAGTILAISGLFDALYLRIFFAAVFLISAKDIFRKASTFSFPKNLFKEHILLKSVLIFWVFANFLLAFSPITGNDSLMYHVPIMFDIVNREEATFSPEIDGFYAYLPVFAEITYAVPIAIFGEHSGFVKPPGRKIDVPPDIYVFQLVQYSVLVLFLGLFYFFLKNFVADKLFIFGALFFTAGIFDLQRELLHAGYIDVFTFLFAIASTLLIIQAFRENNPSKKFLLSSIMFGLALGMKYLALIFGLINFIFIMIFFLIKKWKVGASTKQLLLYGIAPLLISGFWYVKNIFAYGNPVYPMFSSGDFTSGIAWFMAERTPLNFILFPFILSARWFFDATQTSSRLLTLGSFAVFYLLILFFLLKREKIEARNAMIFLFIQIYLSIMFFMSHQHRFLLPAMMVLVLGVFILLDKFMPYVKFKKTVRGLLIASCLILFLANFHYFGVKFLYLTGVYDRATYIHEIGGQ
ncbi:hypothetical protein A2W54_00725 [Candidatus Giovannonibacteria bacterium RIFCSPHIGHO2_02_43_13]|uniref:Glycosyltransferase RgtA/B/C/D-like domain-containing protein n=1 Tax=Candidatus Giovannonibacteria bacterium RIFCSPHIGHO2_02_43_13 TaxID=1798330 RepID=A0A1F5WU38_9BACT|nr:MAG: hypothetical protein A3E06_02075 [Candidatus Giovannonibacteria bacterium RIFCSPHIGHO2_12_FULL_44_42]OGF79167.1 MAG: hypothetical protein A2W54_00725 [Candidatus Giovannonibacteria bacterium RIFCSPHIGHO2_02_43_13]OGF90297.1 MAG: hypothetical protein A3I94_03240 [Candidatus Giovannonibacteria bacterium RIFCSPLOWO2_02_FULL_43_54]OGF97520.1 MAG: hypothetical protein A3H08_00125 [Candidatus Giovannonibacteria bacterium RIFCSPLOWO2_12_FULL_44_32]